MVHAERPRMLCQTHPAGLAFSARHAGCVVLLTIAIIFGRQAAQRLTLKLLRCDQNQERARHEPAQQEQARIEQELRSLTPEQVIAG